MSFAQSETTNELSAFTRRIVLSAHEASRMLKAREEELNFWKHINALTKASKSSMLTTSFHLTSLVEIPTECSTRKLFPPQSSIGKLQTATWKSSPWTQFAEHSPDVVKHCSTACNLHFYVRNAEIEILILTAALHFPPLVISFCFYRKISFSPAALLACFLFLLQFVALCKSWLKKGNVRAFRVIQSTDNRIVKILLLTHQTATDNHSAFKSELK